MSAAARRDRLREVLVGRGLDGAFVTELVNVRYLTGFTGSNGAVLVPVEGDAVLLTDGRYQDQAAAEAPDVELAVTRELLAVGAGRTSGRWAVETHALSVDDHAVLTGVADGTELVSLERAVETLRVVKDEPELDALRRACAISVQAWEELVAGPVVGRTERQLARQLESRMLDLGAEAIAFETILAAGENSAIPHHHPTDRVVKRGDLLKTDFGARVDGYHADCTRTAVVGPPADWQREIHAAVQASQAAGVDALVAGTPVADTWHAAVDVLDASGWRESFTTGLGHGVGLVIHEDPFLGPSHPGTLDRRTAVTMEPGIYLPGRGGVRIEDTVIVTEGRPEVLTTMTRDLLEIG